MVFYYNIYTYKQCIGVGSIVDAFFYRYELYRSFVCLIAMETCLLHESQLFWAIFYAIFLCHIGFLTCILLFEKNNLFHTRIFHKMLYTSMYVPNNYYSLNLNTYNFFMLDIYCFFIHTVNK